MDLQTLKSKIDGVYISEAVREKLNQILTEAENRGELSEQEKDEVRKLIELELELSNTRLQMWKDIKAALLEIGENQ